MTPQTSKRARLLWTILCCTALLCAACGDDGDGDNNTAVANNDPQPDADDGDAADDGDVDDDQDTGEDEPEDLPPGPATMRFDPASTDFFDLPMPDDQRFVAHDGPGLTQWPVAYENGIIKLWFDAGEELMEGWGLQSAIFTWMTDALDPDTLPDDPMEAVEGDLPPVMLVDIDPQSPEQGRRLPLVCKYTDPEGTVHPAHQLACRSPFGIVRRPNTRYAFVITHALLDSTGAPVQTPAAMTALLDGQPTDGPNGAPVDPEPYRHAVEVLGELGVERQDITSVTLVTTHDPAERMRRIGQWYNDLPDPTLPENHTFELVEVYDDYVVLQGEYDIPVIQEGERPYALPPAGKILFGDDGEPTIVETQRIPFLISIPRQPMPEGGWPLLQFMHGSGGEAAQLTDRGPLPSPPPGSGPAGVIAPYGIAGFSADFPLHGARHTPPDRTGLQLYNLIGNPRATVDNFIVAACETTLHVRLLANMTIDPDVAAEYLDPGDDPDGLVRFNAARISSMGQSMGSTIGLPALTVDRITSASILSGSGGILVEIAVESSQPVPIARLLGPAIGYRRDEELDQFDPMLHAVQHIWDFVDTTVHARHVIAEPYEGMVPKHILQHSGLTDGYFSPTSRAALAASLGLDLVEPVLEPEALDIMAMTGHPEAIPTPAGGNLEDNITGVSIQYAPAILDGHHVAYQRNDAKAQYACFLRSVGIEPAPVLRSVEASALENCP